MLDNSLRGALRVITVVELEEIVALSHDLRSILPRRNFNWNLAHPINPLSAQSKLSTQYQPQPAINAQSIWWELSAGNFVLEKNITIHRCLKEWSDSWFLNSVSRTKILKSIFVPSCRSPGSSPGRRRQLWIEMADNKVSPLHYQQLHCHCSQYYTL